jgi:hypothetical protein
MMNANSNSDLNIFFRSITKPSRYFRAEDRLLFGPESNPDKI